MIMQPPQKKSLVNIHTHINPNNIIHIHNYLKLTMSNHINYQEQLENINTNIHHQFQF